MTRSETNLLRTAMDLISQASWPCNEALLNMRGIWFIDARAALASAPAPDPAQPDAFAAAEKLLRECEGAMYEVSMVGSVTNWGRVRELIRRLAARREGKAGAAPNDGAANDIATVLMAIQARIREFGDTPKAALECVEEYVEAALFAATER